MLEVFGAIAGPLFGSGGLVDDLWTTDEEKAKLEADKKAAEARLAEAKAAPEVAAIRAANAQRMALFGLGGLGLVVLGGVAIAALKD